MRRRAKTIAERVAALEDRLAHLEARAEPEDVGRGLHTVRELRSILRFPSDDAVRTSLRRRHIVGATQLALRPLGAYNV